MLSREELVKIKNMLVNAREEINNGWTPEVDRLIRDVIWLATKVVDVNAEAKALEAALERYIDAI
jgi:hypothetical protein